MNKLDPFEGDEESSDVEVAPTASLTDLPCQQLFQDQVY